MTIDIMSSSPLLFSPHTLQLLPFLFCETADGIYFHGSEMNLK